MLTRKEIEAERDRIGLALSAYAGRMHEAIEAEEDDPEHQAIVRPEFWDRMQQYEGAFQALQWVLEEGPSPTGRGD